MATWWKKVVFSNWLKFIIVIGICISSSLVVNNFLEMNMAEPQHEKSYVDTKAFRQEFIQKAGFLRDWIVRYSDESIFTEVTEKQIKAYIEKDGRNLSEKEAIQGIVNDRNEYYNQIQRELVFNNVNIDYIAVNLIDNKFITNMDGSAKVQELNEDNEIAAKNFMNEITSRSSYLIGNGYYILQVKYSMDGYDSYYNGHYFMDNSYYTGDSFETQDNYKVYIALKDKLVEGDNFYEGYNNFVSRASIGKNGFNYFLKALVIMLVLILLLEMVAGRKSEDDQIHFNRFDQVPFEIQFILMIISFLIGISMLLIYDNYFNVYDSFLMVNMENNILTPPIIILDAIVIIEVLSLLAIVTSWVKHIKNRSFLKHGWIIKMGTKVYERAQNERKLMICAVGLVVFNMLISLVAISVVEEASYGVISYNFAEVIRLVVLVWNVCWGLLFAKFILDYKYILKGAKAIASGELDRKIEVSTTVPILNDMAQIVNSIGTGLEKAVDESIKSERLKTELITNVSHDLKTPLTSIISYIDLLKSEPIDNATAREYIEVLDERSHRLKQLVEDLVEASKAVTGNVKADLNVLRLDELVGQAIGEYTDRVEASGLSIVMDQVEDVYVLADGRHMWRITENLLSNVCKYAMPHTRVYVQVEKKADFGILTVKNISRDALNINSDELTERFVRGDSSRTTEGSGLGLAIAQSLARLQNGELVISIDGDLFKVSVSIPVGQLDIVKDDKVDNQSIDHNQIQLDKK